MITKFYNARILAMDGITSLTEGELIVSGSQIVALGKRASFDGTIDREIDCRGNLLMPGFKNAHTHSGMTFLRSLADDLPLQRWLTEQVFRTVLVSTARRPRDRNGDGARERTALLPLEILPGGLKAGVILCMQRRFGPERNNAAGRHLGDRETGVRAADIDRDDGFAHDSPLPVHHGRIASGMSQARQRCNRA